MHTDIIISGDTIISGGQPTRARRRRALAMFVAFSLLSATAVWTTTAPAAACSCETGSLDSFMNSDGGFIGVATERTYLPGDARIITYDVEQWLVGSETAQTFELHTSGDGASCGFNGRTDVPVAIFYDERDGLARASLCSDMSATIARLQMVPEAVDPNAGAARWAAISEASPHLWLLDAEGRIAGYTDEAPTDDRYGPRHSAQCAGTELWVETWWDQESDSTVISTRDLTSLAIVDTFTTTTTGIASIGCLGSSRTDIWIANREYIPPDRYDWWLTNPATGAEVPVPAGDGFYEAAHFNPTDGTAIVFSNDEVTRINPTRGSAEPLVDLTVYPTREAIDHGGKGSISPDGSTFALLLDRIDLPDVTTGFLVLMVDLRTGAVTEFGRDPDHLISDGMTWFSGNRLLLDRWSDEGSAILDPATGSITIVDSKLSGWWADRSMTSEVIGVANGELQLANPFTGDFSTVGTLPVTYPRLALIEPVVSVDADLPIASDLYCLGVAVTVNIGAGEFPTSGDDVIIGTAGDDVIAAGDGDDIVCTGGGDDQIWGQNGNDLIYGGPGDDRIRGGDGNDNLHGGGGADNIAGGRGDDLILGGPGNDTALRGGTGDDVLSGGTGSDPLVSGNGGRDIVRGDDGHDYVLGGPRADLVEGGRGDDVVRGLGGNDTLRGDTEWRSESRDELFGGRGNDSLDAGESGTCNGGTGIDTSISCGLEINMEESAPLAPAENDN